MSNPDPRRFAAATARNREPILAVLREVLPASARVLEIASGTGEHAVFFAAHLPGIVWQPSDADADALPGIAAWRSHAGLDDVAEPIHLDVCDDSWPIAEIDAIFCANMIHIAPWSACLGLMAGAERHLVRGGALVVYGPYRIGGSHTAPSNERFDADLRARDPSWGVRDLEAVTAAAATAGLALERRVEMPANNQTLIFRRAR